MPDAKQKYVVLRQKYFGAKSEVHAVVSSKDEADKIVADQQGVNDGCSYTIEKA